MINFSRLVKAQEFYSKLGYEYVEVPWIVPNEITKITCPSWLVNYPIGSDGDLVGSGEQSFLHMIHQKILKPGKYQCITPCFRDERVLSELHQRYFMKLELIDCSQPEAPPEELWNGKDAPLRVTKDAWEFFCQNGPFYPYQLGIEDGPGLNEDILAWSDKRHKWIELGSYGVRNHPLVGTWIYGTGCAEPRLSQVLA